jgi:uncharacterized protein with ACT and thioredoxin-like domain
MSRHLEFPRPLAWDDDYWLCRCEGFRVDAPAGRVGLVEAVRFGSRLDRPDELLVRGGVLGNRQLVVAVSDVQRVIPRQQRIVVLSTQVGGRHDRLALRVHLRRNRRPEAGQPSG